jgi:hypothetical protein
METGLMTSSSVQNVQ